MFKLASMSDVDYERAYELKMLDELYLDDDEYWSYVILRGMRVRIVVD